MIIVLQRARGVVNFHLLSGSTENSVAFSDADGATSSSSNYRVATMRSTVTVAMAEKVAFTTSRPWSHADILGEKKMSQAEVTYRAVHSVSLGTCSRNPGTNS
jgi:hypothetical protein